jgi:hypothetical protein
VREEVCLEIFHTKEMLAVGIRAARLSHVLPHPLEGHSTVRPRLLRDRPSPCPVYHRPVETADT